MRKNHTPMQEVVDANSEKMNTYQEVMNTPCGCSFIVLFIMYNIDRGSYGTLAIGNAYEK